jgi:secreted trypsin-like serine protease
MNKVALILSVFFLVSCSSKKSNQSQFQATKPSAIIGGSEVPATSPISRLTVGLYDKRTGFVCTGSVIREDLVVTAAHCIESKASDIIIIFALDFSAYDNNESKSLRIATDVKVHENFKLDNPSALDWDDIALIRFSGGLPEGYAAIQILKDTSLLKQGTAVQMAGYGASGAELEEVNAKKDKKFKQDLASGEIICYDKTYTHCYRITFSGTDHLRSTEATIEGFTEKEIRMNESKGHGTCVGDSGGPLIYQNTDGTLNLIGATSRGSEFCDGPAIYTNVTEYVDWIQKTSAAMK